MGEKDYSIVSRLNGQPSAIIAVYQLPGSNAVQTAEGVRKLMAEMKQRFPQDMDYAIALDQTAAVTEGMKEIIVTLVIAIVLVILVVYLFLQDWRATLIPMLAVPVSLVGTFVLFPLSVFPSTPFPCSDWCWLLAWLWTMPSLSSRAYSATSRRACVPRMRLGELWKSFPALSSVSP